MSNYGWKGRRLGQSVIELAVAAPLMTLMLFGIVDFGRAFFQYIAVIEAAREGARYATYGVTNLSNPTTPRPRPHPGRTQSCRRGPDLPQQPQPYPDHLLRPHRYARRAVRPLRL